MTFNIEAFNFILKPHQLENDENEVRLSSIPPKFVPFSPDFCTNTLVWSLNVINKQRITYVKEIFTTSN